MLAGTWRPRWIRPLSTSAPATTARRSDMSRHPFGWDLPPGVTMSMIPGNRPEDLAEEEFWEAFEDKLTEAQIVAFGDLPAGGSANTVSVDVLWDNTDFVKLVQIAR